MIKKRKWDRLLVVCPIMYSYLIILKHHQNVSYESAMGELGWKDYRLDVLEKQGMIDISEGLIKITSDGREILEEKLAIDAAKKEESKSRIIH